MAKKTSIKYRKSKVDWKKLTHGFITKSVDACLWSLFFVFDLAQKKSVYEAMTNPSPIADGILEQLNDHRMKKALQTAQRQKLIIQSGVKGKDSSVQISKAGFERLSMIIPHYDTVRVWNNMMYVITYDIVEKQRHLRNRMRKQLKIIGATPLQASVWTTPYNPTTILKDFARRYHLRGSIIISALGEDGSIGDENLRDFIVRVYRLRQLNQRYENFMTRWNKKKIDSLAVAQFLSILRDDPQLPFALLPHWWKGDKAFKHVAPLLKKFYSSQNNG